MKDEIYKRIGSSPKECERRFLESLSKKEEKNSCAFNLVQLNGWSCRLGLVLLLKIGRAQNDQSGFLWIFVIC